MKYQPKNPETLFKKLKYGLLKQNFRILSQKEKELRKKVEGHEDPKDVPRIIETAPQVEFNEQFSEYTIQILSSYRKDKKGFTNHGRVWCNILAAKIDIGFDTKYTRSIFRKGDFVDRTLVEAKFLCHALRNRPIDSKNRPMVLVEMPRGFFNWVSVSNEQEKISFYHSIPPEILSDVLESKYQRERYITVTRERKGIRSWARDNRKRGKKRTPNNAVTVAI